MTYLLPIVWLLRYLLGVRGVAKLPMGVFTPKIVETLLFLEEESGDGHAYWHDTRDYEGEGFWGRPSLFYLIGCFTAKVERLAEGVKISLKDVYDWHPSVQTTTAWEVEYQGGCGEWYTQTFLHWPTAANFCRSVGIDPDDNIWEVGEVDYWVWYCSAIPQWLLSPLNKLFPRFFVLATEERWKYNYNSQLNRWEKFIGEGVSNELWMVWPTAKPFTSTFEGVVPYPPQKVENVELDYYDEFDE